LKCKIYLRNLFHNKYCSSNIQEGISGYFDTYFSFLSSDLFYEADPAHKRPKYIVSRLYEKNILGSGESDDYGSGSCLTTYVQIFKMKILASQCLQYFFQKFVVNLYHMQFYFIKSSKVSTEVGAGTGVSAPVISIENGSLWPWLWEHWNLLFEVHVYTKLNYSSIETSYTENSPPASEKWTLYEIQ
jgi:hypothetical protein